MGRLRVELRERSDAVMDVPRFGQREWERVLTCPGTATLLGVHGIIPAARSLLRPCTRVMDELLERRLWVLCPKRASMVESNEPRRARLEPGQRSPRDGAPGTGGTEADRLTGGNGHVICTLDTDMARWSVARGALAGPGQSIREGGSQPAGPSNIAPDPRRPSMPRFTGPALWQLGGRTADQWLGASVRETGLVMR